MQSSANMQLSPEEYPTVSVSANDLSDLSEGGLCMVRMSRFPVCNRNECIPTPPLKEVYPGLF